MEVKEKRQVSKFYDNLGGSLYDERYQLEQKAKYHEILKHCVISENSIVLDDGCGTGLFLSKLRGFSVGVDLSPSLISVARQRKLSRMKNHLMLADADELPFKDYVFHKILAVTLIQNMPEPLQTLSEIRRVSRENVDIIITALKKSFTLQAFQELLMQSNFISEKIITDEKLKDWIAFLKLKRINILN